MNKGAKASFWRAIAADHERIENGDDNRVPAQQEWQQHGGDTADHRAGDSLAQRVAGVEYQLAVHQLRGKARQRRPRRTEPVVADDYAAELPGAEDNDADQQPVEYRAPTNGAEPGRGPGRNGDGHAGS